MTDEPKRAGGDPGRVRVDRQVVAIGEPEQADQVHRIAREGVGGAQVDPAMIVDEILRLDGGGAETITETADPAVEDRRALGMPRLEGSADDGCEITHFLGDQKIGLHEALDARQAAARLVAEAFGDPRLQAEREPLLGPSGDEMHVAADAPEQFLAALEHPVLLRREQAGGDEFALVADAVGVFRDPEQRVEVAQAALPVLDVGLDEVARGPRFRDAGIALAQLGLDEFRRRPHDELGVEPRDQLLVQRPRAEEVARLEEGGADRHVGPPLAQALLHRARGVADLQLQVPQHVEHRLDDALGPGGLLVGKQEQEIDVRSRRHRATAVTAGGHHRELLAGGGIVIGVEPPHHRIVDRADHRIGEVADALGAGGAVALLHQPGFGIGMSELDDAAELRHEKRAQLRRLAHVAVESGEDRLEGVGGVEHAQTRYHVPGRTPETTLGRGVDVMGTRHDVVLRAGKFV